MASSENQPGTSREANREADKPARSRRRRRIGPIGWAAIFALLLVGWLASGEFIVGGSGSADQTPRPANGAAGSSAKSDSAPFKVRVATINARERKAELVLRGRTAAEARVNVKAETAGVVEALGHNKGDVVSAGQELCRVEDGAREAAVLEAEAQLAEAAAAFEATTKLQKRGYAASLKAKSDKAKLDAADAALRRARLDLERTSITAPFEAVVEAEAARVGDYLSVGATCATVVRLDPLLVVAAISERDVARVATGATAFAELVTGERVEGRISFIAPSADTKTRTFRIEAEIPNPERRLRDGVTADLRIPLEAEPAHRLPPSILTLSDAGEIGVRTVDANNVVAFQEVEVLGQDREGVWVRGLPNPARVITVGQEYVVKGQSVQTIEGAAPDDASEGSMAAIR